MKLYDDLTLEQLNMDGGTTSMGLVAGCNAIGGSHVSNRDIGNLTVQTGGTREMEPSLGM